MGSNADQEAVLMYALFLKARHGAAASKFARKTATKLRGSDEGDLAGYKSGMLSQMPWSDLPLGLGHDCSPKAGLRNPPQRPLLALSGHL